MASLFAQFTNFCPCLGEFKPSPTCAAVVALLKFSTANRPNEVLQAVTLSPIWANLRHKALSALRLQGKVAKTDGDVGLR